MRIYCTVAAAMLFSFAAHAQTASVTPNQVPQVTQSGFSPLYVGVDFETATLPSNPTTTGGTPTTSRAYIARIDLNAPGIALVTTSHSGPLNTISETVSQFATRTRVRLAINANFFTPCCGPTQPETIRGLLVSSGKVVSPVSTDPTHGEAVLAFMRGNQAVISSGLDLKIPQVVTAVAGAAIIVQNGKDISASAPSFGQPNDPEPRTVVGLSDHGRYLYLVAIDGRLTGYSTGVTYAQAAALMIAMGCDSAVNLDGGGSTEMVRADVLGQPYVLNTTSAGGTERFVGASLGIYALELPKLPFE